jgi:hypothetical protein
VKKLAELSADQVVYGSPVLLSYFGNRCYRLQPWLITRPISASDRRDSYSTISHVRSITADGKFLPSNSCTPQAPANDRCWDSGSGNDRNREGMLLTSRRLHFWTIGQAGDCSSFSTPTKTALRLSAMDPPPMVTLFRGKTAFSLKQIANISPNLPESANPQQSQRAGF